MSKIPPEPTEAELWLFSQNMAKVEVDYEWYFNETRVRFSGGNWRNLDDLRKYLDFRPSHNAVWELAECSYERVKAWKNHLEANRAKLAEYERLKAELFG